MENSTAKYSKKEIFTGILFAYLTVHAAIECIRYMSHTVEPSVIGIAPMILSVLAQLLIVLGLIIKKGQKVIQFGVLVLLITEVVYLVQSFILYGNVISIIIYLLYFASAFLMYRFVSNVYSGKQDSIEKAKKIWYMPAFCICLILVIEAALSSVFISIFVIGIAYLFLASTVLDHVLSEKEREANNNALLMFGIGAVVVLGVLFFVTDGPSHSSDIAYDEDGFLGYSDGFWEWMRKQ